MTLQDLFEYTRTNPNFLFFYFFMIPFTALLIGVFGKGEGHISPWNYVYSILIYLVSIPAILAVGLNIYFFLFQRGDILQTNLYTQVLPIIVLFITVWLIRRNVDLKLIPGFSTLTGLWLMLFSTMALMFLIDRTRIFVFTYMPFQYLAGVFLVLFFVIYLGWRRFTK